MCDFYILLSQMVFSQIKNVEDSKPNNYSALNMSSGNIISDESLKKVSGTDLCSEIPWSCNQ